MQKFKVYKNLTEFEIVEAETAIKAQWMCEFLPYRVIAVSEDGGVNIPEGYTKINTENKNQK